MIELRRGCLVCARVAVKTYYPHPASLEVHAPAVVGRILYIFVLDPGGSSLFCHRRSLPTRAAIGSADGIGPGLCDITNGSANFVEQSFCQLHCNSCCDHPHNYPLRVNI